MGLSFGDLVTVIWFALDAGTHLTIEAAYLYLALGTTAVKSDTYFGHIWREYARADSRWAIRDPVIISLELMTVLVMGPLCVIQLYGLLQKKPWRHALQILICTAELYGGWMTFCPEWVDSNPNLDGSDFVLFWIYLVFMNGLWVIVPLLLLVDSFYLISSSVAVAENIVTKGKDKDLTVRPAYNWLYPVISVFLLLYVILVPLVLFTAEGVPPTLSTITNNALAALFDDFLSQCNHRNSIREGDPALSNT